jgi:hypothetical protein
MLVALYRYTRTMMHGQQNIKHLNSNRNSSAIEILRIFWDLGAKFLLIKMRFLADIRFVPLEGKPNIIKFEHV